MEFLPLFMRLQERPVLLVGGGAVALRKARLLHRAGARIRVVAPSVHAELAALATELQEREFQDADLADVVLVIAATDDEALNRRLAERCGELRLPINVVDNPTLCTVVIPTIVDRSPLVLAISSGGRAPVLARMLRARLETMVPAAYGKLAELAGAFRGEVKQRIADPERRRHFWEQVLEGPAAEMVLAGNLDGARQRLREELAHSEEEGGAPVGEVYLVGAGPGDPDLLTFKALRLMQKADVVLYDRLVAPEIVSLVRKDAEMIYVGKQQDQHTVPQGDINQLLVTLARQGRRVLRLKGGDPFIFGRGGEEIEELAAHRIPFQVVPGITAASGCACYSGIPLTHRDHAQSVRFVTGHLKEGSTELDWEELVNPHETVVFYMGMGALAEICRQLIAHGRAPDTPIALIRKGTTPEQKVATGSLASLPDSVDREAFRPPTLIIVGEVVRLREKLAWFES